MKRMTGCSRIFSGCSGCEMERVNKILNHDLFIECLEKNRKAEEGRCFCRHDMGHFLDVARLAMIFYLEQSCPPESGVSAKEDSGGGGTVSKELIYGAALLHDIGRWKQYEDKTPHEKASAALAPAILADCGFTERESAQIVTAILNHRNEKIKARQNLSGILYRADKMSRSCFCCQAEGECDWKGTKKNLELQY